MGPDVAQPQTAGLISDRHTTTALLWNGAADGDATCAFAHTEGPERPGDSANRRIGGAVPRTAGLIARLQNSLPRQIGCNAPLALWQEG